jgi:hypothetical protein
LNRLAGHHHRLGLDTQSEKHVDGLTRQRRRSLF